jgi:hypothetical protein
MSEPASDSSTRPRTDLGAGAPAEVTAAVYRIVWSPGSDRLHGTCHCGAEHVDDDPVRMWQWLLAHPEHDPSVAGVAP